MSRGLERIAPYLLVFLIAAAVAVRLILLVPAAEADPNRLRINDSADYERIAANLVNHGVYSRSAGSPYAFETDRTPVYPLFLALFRWIGFEGVLAPLIVQVALFSVLLIVVYGWASTRFGVGAGCAAVAFCGFEFSGITASVAVMTESIFALLFFGSVVAWDPGETPRSAFRRHLSAGLLAAAILCRPLAVYWVFPAMLLAAVRTRGGATRRIARAVQVAAVPVLVVLGWSYVNSRQGGDFTLSIVEARNLLSYRAASVVAEVEGIPQGEAAERLWAQTRETTESGGAGPRATAMRVFFSHPGATAQMVMKGAAQVLFAPGAGLLLAEAGRPCERVAYRESDMHMSLVERAFRMFSRADAATLLTAASVAFLAVLYSMIAVGAWRAVRTGVWPEFVTMLLPVSYLVLASAGPEAGSRFRTPMLPFLAVVAGWGAAWCAQIVAQSLGKRGPAA